MFSRVNIKERLTQKRDRRIDSELLLQEVYDILQENEEERNGIRKKLTGIPSGTENQLAIQLLDSGRIFHISDIREICIQYRLRFVDSHYFKEAFPEEAISEIRRMENEHETALSNFKIVAPAKLLKLENADDPLLFVKICEDYYYLIHKWGRDLHPFRKLMMWPFQNVVNLVILLFLSSVVLTVLFPMKWFSPSPNAGEYIFVFLLILKSIAGLTVLYGGSKGKNFSSIVWNSKYYNA